MINISDACLNMSDLTNCIKIFVVDKTKFSESIFQHLVNKLIETQGTTEAPVLVFPKDFLIEQEIKYEKIYNMFILSMQHLDSYFSFINKVKARVH